MKKDVEITWVFNCMIEEKLIDIWVSFMNKIGSKQDIYVADLPTQWWLKGLIHAILDRYPLK